MMRFGILVLYNLLLPVALVVGFPKFLIKGIRRGGLARNFRQRLGWYSAEQKRKLRNGEKRNLWIHAVSVGEVRVALKVAAELRVLSPDHQVVISTTTPTGFALAEKEAPAGVLAIYNPIDLPLVVASAMRAIRPQCIVLVEAEVWPNMVNKARRQGVPVVLINARLSARSERRYRQFRALAAPIFQMLQRVAVQFQSDAPRMGALGIAADRIEVTGSVKFDISGEVEQAELIASLRETLQTLNVDAGRPVLLAACTHAGEEAMIAQIFSELRKAAGGERGGERLKDLFLLIVPRHAERRSAVLADVSELGLNAVLKSELDSVNANNAAGSGGEKPLDCLIADTTGELRAWYHLATVVVVGKSFLGHGGQNPVEAVAIGKPVITGPNMENFTDIMADLKSREGVLQLPDAEPGTLKSELLRLLADEDAAATLARSGLSALDQHMGATRRTAEMVIAVTADGAR